MTDHSRRRDYAILMGLAVNAFAIGVSWGSLGAKLDALSDRVDRIESHEDIQRPVPQQTVPYSQPHSHYSSFGPAEAIADTNETTGELSNVSTTNRHHKRP